MPHAKWHGVPVSDEEWFRRDADRLNRNAQNPRLKRGERVPDEEMDMHPGDVAPYPDPSTLVDESGRPLVASNGFATIMRLLKS
jgi:hypothetical protein